LRGCRKCFLLSIILFLKFVISTCHTIKALILLLIPSILPLHYYSDDTDYKSLLILHRNSTLPQLFKQTVVFIIPFFLNSSLDMIFYNFYSQENSLVFFNRTTANESLSPCRFIG